MKNNLSFAIRVIRNWDLQLFKQIKITIMENLKSYKGNGYNDNYVVIVNKTRFEMCDTFVTRKAAEHYNETKLNGDGEVLTFRQAARKFPEYFEY